MIAAGVWVFSGDSGDNQSRAEDLRRRTAMADAINPPGLGESFFSETGARLSAVESAVDLGSTAVKRGVKNIKKQLKEGWKFEVKKPKEK